MRQSYQQSGTAALRVLEPQSVEYGSITITYFVTRTERSRVSIEVHPNFRVIVSAPCTATTAGIRETVKRKASWILKQHRFFADLLPRTPERRFVSGESHLYLGRQYRLRVRETKDDERVKLNAGYLHVYTATPASVDAKQKLLAAWYRGHALRVLPQRVNACLAQPLLLCARPSRIEIRPLRKRWGSCSPAGRLTLNVDLIRAPRGCIDYVITHELCHLLVPNHSSSFIRLLDRVMPDWRERKQQLEQRLA
jgi:predicted metal-dependent hydrolase